MGLVRVEKLKNKKRPFPNYNIIPKLTNKERFNEVLVSLNLIFGKFKFTRKLALRIAVKFK